MSKWIESVARGTHYARAASAPQSGGRKEGRTDGRTVSRTLVPRQTDRFSAIVADGDRSVIASPTHSAAAAS